MNVSHSSNTNVVAVRPDEEERMRAHLKMCLQLYLDNKINKKNVWHLKVITYLSQLMDKSDFFTLACSMLEVAAKVFGIKVDCVHEEVVNFLRDLRRMGTAKPNTDVNEDEMEEGLNSDAAGNNNEQNKRKKKIRVLSANNKATISKNPDKLFTNVPKLPSASFAHKENLFTTSPLLTNKEIMDTTNIEYKMFSKENYWKTADDEDESLNENQCNIQLPELVGGICEQFRNFHSTIWDHNANNPDALFDIVAYNNQGVPIHELDGDLPEPFQDASIHEENEMMPLQEMEFRTSFFPEAGVNHNDRNFCPVDENCEIKYLWAGPSHWQFKYIKPVATMYTGADEKVSDAKQVKQKKKKEAKEYFIDFTNPKPTHPVILQETISNRRKRHCPSNPEKYLRPLKRAFDEDSLNYLSLIHIPIPGGKADIRKNDGMEINNNPIMSEPCDMDIDGFDGGHDDMHALEALPNNPNDPVAEGAHCNIPYVKKSKHINMKKVKGKMLEVINEKAAELSISFTSTYKDLSKSLDSATASKLSVPLAFVTSLYLANENNLALTQEADSLMDFNISKK